jgi:hypothetical protein
MATARPIPLSAPVMIAFLPARRPEPRWRSLVSRSRCTAQDNRPSLPRGTIFYHKGPLPRIPDAVHQLRIEKREGGEGVRVWVDSLAGLLGLVQMDVIEVHPWAATVDDIEHADRLVFDLDPGPGISWDFVIASALCMRGLLEREGLKSWPKLTGGKGLHARASTDGERGKARRALRLCANRQQVLLCWARPHRAAAARCSGAALRQVLCRRDAFGSVQEPVPPRGEGRRAGPLNTASRRRPSSVIPPYSISDWTIGLTQVAFGFLTGTDKGECLTISGSSRSRTSRATASV